EFGVAGGVMGSHVIDGPSESVTEEVAPHAVDHGLGELGGLIFGGLRNEFGEFCAAIDTGTWVNFVSLEAWEGDLHHAAAFFEEDGTGEFLPDDFGVIVDLATGFGIEFAMIFLADLAEEAVEFPELVLLPFIERVIVALGALDLEAEEQAGGHGGELNTIVGHLHLGEDVVHGAVFFEVSGGRDEFDDDFVPWAIFGKCFAEEFFHAGAADALGCTATDAVVGPDGGEVPHVVFVFEERVDEERTFAGVFIFEEGFDFGERRDASYEVKVDAADPFFVGGSGGGFDFVVGPSEPDLFVNELAEWYVG
ncbi:MAG: hypothetical protein RL215_45, partial [Planctomycetota bacterium]